MKGYNLQIHHLCLAPTSHPTHTLGKSQIKQVSWHLDDQKFILPPKARGKSPLLKACLQCSYFPPLLPLLISASAGFDSQLSNWINLASNHSHLPSTKFRKSPNFSVTLKSLKPSCHFTVNMSKRL